ncbi:3-deoxy-7-phosphoheptulonate synthase [Alloscardovia macacae]|uniref:3-deoxy-7-phosphoheptulonate synthase n=1 Tax=Alloscardovia macacae TaxID=1160091 RepID=A0A1Y2T0P6_9BIFI|nr:3-deoxy-7-phosphoheptulonate synthase [Alloscardovia macacae]OTA27315.1 3-deoxy-7-phosphoheptulonate synthase [Alloscardovia macacae]OTA29323.1 3-deoxy-7-phosphoheptulonate synthase [Alloscardovia macacae]
MVERTESSDTAALEAHAQQAARHRAYLHTQIAKSDEANPLNLPTVQRWEDEVGLAPILNRRVLELDALPSPATVLQALPLSDFARQLVVESREETRAVLSGEDDRLLVIVGPCSIHDPQAALDYARRLGTVRRELEDDLLIIMRVYFEKPRTTIGWKGLINDPDLDGSHKINKGLLLARQILLDVLDCGVAAATEFLEPTSPQYISDAVTWGAIGARNTESQVHRQLASGLSMPVGFKNATDGSVEVAVDSVYTAAQQHTFFGIDHQGRAAAVETLGNPDCHVVLRGSSSGPNYDAVSVADALSVARSRLSTDSLGAHGLIIDASHGNSGKDEIQQARVVRSVAARLAEGEQGISGIMMESFIQGGNQKAAPLAQLEYGKSVTDKCIAWPETENLLRDLAAAVRARREL